MGGFWQATRHGNYPLQGDIGQADSAIALSFSPRPLFGAVTAGHVNERLAEVANDYDLPVVAQAEVAWGVAPDLLIGAVAEPRPGRHYDTHEVLAQAAGILATEGLRSSILIAQAHHVRRAMLHAVRLDIDVVLLPGLPKEWDEEALQWWTKSVGRWCLREVMGYPWLKLQGKL